MKKILSLALALMLMLSIGTAAYAAPVRASDESAAAQIKLLCNSFGAFRQDDSWSYTVTDLNHNGRLELIASSIQGTERYTLVKLWEVGEDLNSVTACRVEIPEDESFPDILTENADTFYNPGNDLWYYTFYDNIVLSPEETYYARCAVNLDKGVLSFQQLAVQHTTLTGGVSITEYMDNNGDIISAEQYNSAGLTGSADYVRSSTNFDWFSAASATEDRLAASYAVNKGVSQLAANAAQTATAPAAAPAPTDFLTVTKSPTNESHSAGETAYFISNASSWTSLSWTFISPYGGEFNAQSFRSTFPYASVSGENGTTLTIANVGGDMSGWGVYCTFYNNSQTARTNTAYLYITTPQKSTNVQNTVTCPNCGTRNVSIYGNCWNCGFDVYAYVNGWNGTVYAPSYYSYYYDPDVIFMDDGSIGVVEANGDFTVYSGNGASVTYGWDGSTYYDYGNGSYVYEANDGSAHYFDDEGNWASVDSDGSWLAYDAWSNTQSGGYGSDWWSISDDYEMEAYSSLYGWGYLDDDWNYWDFY